MDIQSELDHAREQWQEARYKLMIASERIDQVQDIFSQQYDDEPDINRMRQLDAIYKELKELQNILNP